MSTPKKLPIGKEVRGKDGSIWVRGTTVAECVTAALILVKEEASR